MWFPNRMHITYIYDSFSSGFRGCVSDDGKGGYIILLNDTLSAHDRECTILHELRHIYRDDLNLGVPKAVDLDEVLRFRIHTFRIREELCKKVFSKS